MTVTRACASGLQAITMAAADIERGDVEVVIAGGSDSTSNAELKLPQKVVHAVAPLAFGKATPGDMLGVLGNLLPLTEILPRMPKIAERTTGQVMGEAAEEMARRNEISATSAGRAGGALAPSRRNGHRERALRRRGGPLETPAGKWVHADGLVRADTSVDKLAKLKPVFAKSGTLTAGNSSPLTDGAAAVLLMSEDKARALGFTPRAAFRSWSYVGVDPADQLLMGPALAMPNALERAGMLLSDVDLVDMHEAFAAQVLSILKMLSSRAFARERLGRDARGG